jgi:hypothetical protein
MEPTVAQLEGMGLAPSVRLTRIVIFTRRWLSSGFQHHVDWYEFTDISEVCTASNIRAVSHHHPDDGGSTDP